MFGSLCAQRTKIIPNTIIEQPPLISDNRSAAHSGNKSFLADISAEIPYINAYDIPKIRNMEPTTIRNVPAMAIDLLFNAPTFNQMTYYFKLY